MRACVCVCVCVLLLVVFALMFEGVMLGGGVSEGVDRWWFANGYSISGRSSRKSSPEIVCFFSHRFISTTS